MIAAARRRLNVDWNDDPRIRFEQMDAEQLELEADAFDVVLSAFALTHVPRPEVALREMWRVLRPGGRLAVALGSQPPVLSLDQLRHAISEVGRKIAEFCGRRLTPSALDAIVERAVGHSNDAPVGSPLSVQLNRAGLLRSFIRDAGFTSLRTSWRNYQNEIEAAGEYWDLYRTIRSDVRKLLLTAPPALVEQLRREFLDTCRSVVEGGGVLAYPISVVFITARKPTSR
jgi:ubiquinone/menaquinone biosynthesis C-methylase UbiE